MTEHEYLTPQEVADLFRVPLDTVRYWRKRGDGPIPVKVGKHLRYPIDRVDAYRKRIAA